MNIKVIWGFALARLNEPSTWASIAVALVAAFPNLRNDATFMYPFVAAVLGGIGLPEAKSPAPPAA